MESYKENYKEKRTSAWSEAEVRGMGLGVP